MTAQTAHSYLRARLETPDQEVLDALFGAGKVFSSKASIGLSVIVPEAIRLAEETANEDATPEAAARARSIFCDLNLQTWWPSILRQAVRAAMTALDELERARVSARRRAAIIGNSGPEAWLQAVTESLAELEVEVDDAIEAEDTRADVQALLKSPGATKAVKALKSALAAFEKLNA